MKMKINAASRLTEVEASTALIEKLVKEGGDREHLEAMWKKAIGIANAAGIKAYPYAMAVFMRLKEGKGKK